MRLLLVVMKAVVMCGCETAQQESARRERLASMYAGQIAAAVAAGPKGVDALRAAWAEEDRARDREYDRAIEALSARPVYVPERVLPRSGVTTHTGATSYTTYSDGSSELTTHGGASDFTTVSP
jgi:hypothetical protein